MAKITKYRSYNENILEFLDSAKEEVKAEGIENMILLSKRKDGEIMLGFSSNLDIGTKQELCSHLQVQIMDDIIKQNYVTPE